MKPKTLTETLTETLMNSRAETAGKEAGGTAGADGSGRILKTLYFSPDGVLFMSCGRGALDETGELLRAGPGRRVTLRGYTAPYAYSSPGIQRSLSRLRAGVCARYLMKEYRIEEERITVEWYGAERLPESWDGSGQAQDCVEMSIEEGVNEAGGEL